MNSYFKFIRLPVLFLLLFIFNINAQNNQNQAANKNNGNNNLDYVASASVVVSKLIVKQVESGEWMEHILLYPREIQLVPASNDFAKLLFELDCSEPENCVEALSVGEYDRVRAILDSGTVTLSDETRVTDGTTFSTELGNLKLTSGPQTGLKAHLKPSITVITTLSPELTLDLDLSKSFVFNGSPTNGKGVKSVVITTVIPTMNTSTHGRITVNIQGSLPPTDCDDDLVYAPLEGAMVEATDTSGNTVNGVSDSNGDVIFVLIPGSYTIEITAEDRDTITLENIEVYLANETALGEVKMDWSPDTPGHNTVTITEIKRIDECNYEVSPFENATVKAIDLAGIVDDVLETTDAIGMAVLELLPGFYNIKVIAEGRDTITLKNDDGTEIFEVCPALITSTDGQLGREVASIAFDPEERAILLGNMASAGYNGVISDTCNTANGDCSEPIDYSCWARQGDEIFIESSATNAYVFYNSKTGDVVVTFEGSQDLMDYTLEAAVIRAPWNGNDLAVHTGVLTAWESIKDAIKTRITDARNSALDSSDLLFQDNPRISFTGHSLGGALATIAALDLSDYLVDQGYKKDNIIMYSYGAPRSLTQHMQEIFINLVPNGYAIAARDDWAPYINESLVEDEFQYAHIYNLRVLSTNIIDNSLKEVGEAAVYQEIGASRWESSLGIHFDGCEAGTKHAGAVSDYYNGLGNESIQYVWRIKNIGGNPAIELRTLDLNYQLSWSGGVQGPCDWVGLYAGESKPTDPNDYVEYTLVPQWIWALTPDEVNHSFTDLNTSLTLVPKADDAKYWIGYVDGFDRFVGEPKAYVAGSKSVDIKTSTSYDFILYPNSVDNIINIKGVETSSNRYYNIYNSLGSPIISGGIENNQVDVSTLPQGIYILKVATEKGVSSQKFIKN